VAGENEANVMPVEDIEVMTRATGVGAAGLVMFIACQVKLTVGFKNPWFTVHAAPVLEVASTYDVLLSEVQFGSKVPKSLSMKPVPTRVPINTKSMLCIETVSPTEFVTVYSLLPELMYKSVEMWFDTIVKNLLVFATV
jgi:hypothetical protein